MKIVLTDDGAKKMRDLSIAQMNKLIALVLDGKVVWTPKVRREIGKTGDFTGSGPRGLEMDVIRRLIAIVPAAPVQRRATLNEFSETKGRTFAFAACSFWAVSTG